MVPWIGVCRVPVQHDEQAHEAGSHGRKRNATGFISIYNCDDKVGRCSIKRHDLFKKFRGPIVGPESMELGP